MTDAEKAFEYLKYLYENGMTQSEISAKLGIAQSQIHNLLSGKSSFARSSAQTVEKVLSLMSNNDSSDIALPLVPKTQTRAVSLDVIFDALMASSEIDSDTKVKVYNLIKNLYKD